MAVLARGKAVGKDPRQVLGRYAFAVVDDLDDQGVCLGISL